MAFLIETKNSNFTGVRYGVVFHNGQATTDDAKLAKKIEKEFGYKVTDVSKTAATQPPDAGKKEDDDKKNKQ